MDKIIKDGGLIQQEGLGTIIKPDAPLHETTMENFIGMIEAAEEQGVYDDYMANAEEVEEIAKNDTSKRLLALLEDCSDVYAEMYKKSGKDRFVNFDIEFSMSPSPTGQYIGSSTCNLLLWEHGKKQIVVSKTFGFATIEEVKKNDWGEILLVQVVAELFGSMHILTNLKGNVKQGDLIKQKLKNAKLKENEKDN